MPKRRELTKVRKMYELDHTVLQHGYKFLGIECYAKSIDQAKVLLFRQLKLTSAETPIIDNEECTPIKSYLDIPVRRREQEDIIIFRGKEIMRADMQDILDEESLVDGINYMLKDDSIKYVYIKKHNMYRTELGWYVNDIIDAGVFDKKVASEIVLDLVSKDGVHIMVCDKDQHQELLDYCERIKRL